MGAWFSYGENKIGQGREKAKRYLLENDSVRDEIVGKVKAFLGIDED